MVIDARILRDFYRFYWPLEFGLENPPKPTHPKRKKPIPLGLKRRSGPACRMAEALAMSEGAPE